jgi:CRP/FNR family cyclic AMP-dependent transcriptional regulator
MATAIAMSECTIVRVDKEAAIRVLHDEPDLVDQLFNSSEMRLARVLLLLANYERFGLKSIPAASSSRVSAMSAEWPPSS